MGEVGGDVPGPAPDVHHGALAVVLQDHVREGGDRMPFQRCLERVREGKLVLFGQGVVAGLGSHAGQPPTPRSPPGASSAPHGGGSIVLDLLGGTGRFLTVVQRPRGALQSRATAKTSSRNSLG